MTDTPSPARRGALFNAALALGCALVGGLGGWYWEAHSSGAPMSEAERAEIEGVVQDYLLAHPEVLPKAMAELERKQTKQQLTGVRGEIEQASMATVLGNPRGKFTLVEFTDYACGYCRRSVEDVDRLIAANPDLRVVVRELPILTPQSADAAKMAIAAAAQGRYAEFHRAMFESGHPDDASIEAAAVAAGLDLARARRTIAEPATEAELVRNLDLAKRLGFNGTPSWVIGDTVLTGAVGQDALAQALADARGAAGKS